MLVRTVALASDQVAFGDVVAVDASGQRCADLGVFEIQHAALDGRLGGGDPCLGSKEVKASLVHGLDRDVAALEQLLGAVQLVACVVERGQCTFQFRLGFGQRRLDGPRVDGEQKVAFFDDIAVDELDGLQITADARAYLDLADRIEASDELVVFNDFF